MSELARTLDLFWKLASLDGELHALALREKSERERVARESHKLSEARKTLDNLRDVERRARAAARDAEEALAAHEARLAKLGEQARVDGPTLARENARRDELETAAIQRLEDINTAIEACNRLDAQHATARKALEDAQAQLEHALAQIIPRRAELARQREPIAGEVPQPQREHYDAALRKNPANPLARLDERLCGGCSGELTQQMAMRVRARNELIFCPNCHRLLDS